MKQTTSDKKSAHRHDGPCAIRILQEYYGEEAAQIALSYTCFPMDCKTASLQACAHILKVSKPEDLKNAGIPDIDWPDPDDFSWE